MEFLGRLYPYDQATKFQRQSEIEGSTVLYSWRFSESAYARCGMVL